MGKMLHNIVLQNILLEALFVLSCEGRGLHGVGLQHLVRLHNVVREESGVLVEGFSH